MAYFLQPILQNTIAVINVYSLVSSTMHLYLDVAGIESFNWDALWCQKVKPEASLNK